MIPPPQFQTMELTAETSIGLPELLRAVYDYHSLQKIYPHPFLCLASPGLIKKDEYKTDVLLSNFEYLMFDRNQNYCII